MEAKLLVALNLRRLRVAKAVSQDDLALSAGIERAYVGHLERGGRNPTIATLEKLSSALGVHISELFHDPIEGLSPIGPLRAGRKKS